MQINRHQFHKNIAMEKKRSRPYWLYLMGSIIKIGGHLLMAYALKRSKGLKSSKSLINNSNSPQHCIITMSSIQQTCKDIKRSLLTKQLQQYHHIWGRALLKHGWCFRGGKKWNIIALLLCLVTIGSFSCHQQDMSKPGSIFRWLKR